MAENKDTTKAKANGGEAKPRYRNLVVDGDKYRTLLSKKYKNRKKYEIPNPNFIYSRIPGTVLKVEVEEGQQVKEGDVYIILESMKMRNRLLFSNDGTVKKVHVKEGQNIAKGVLLVELD
jgi:biotin carboxyl carrier protein